MKKKNGAPLGELPEEKSRNGSPVKDPNVAIVAVFGLGTLGVVAIAVTRPEDIRYLVGWVGATVAIALLGAAAAFVLRKVL